jgi:hypothetical protein
MWGLGVESWQFGLPKQEHEKSMQVCFVSFTVACYECLNTND